MTFGVHKLVRSKPNTNTNFDNCCERYIASCGNFFYMCSSTFSALNYSSGIFFKSLSHLYEVGQTDFSAFFWTFHNFLTAISRKLCRHVATKLRTMYRFWKGNHFWKNRWSESRHVTCRIEMGEIDLNQFARPNRFAPLNWMDNYQFRYRITDYRWMLQLTQLTISVQIYISFSFPPFWSCIYLMFTVQRLSVMFAKME